MRAFVFSLLLLSSALADGSASPTHADPKTYCGRVMCGEAVHGCEIHDGRNNPLIMFLDRDLAPSQISKSLVSAIRNMDSQCGCVVGSIVLESVRIGEDFSRFTTV